MMYFPQAIKWVHLSLPLMAGIDIPLSGTEANFFMKRVASQLALTDGK